MGSEASIPREARQFVDKIEYKIKKLKRQAQEDKGEFMYKIEELIVQAQQEKAEFKSKIKKLELQAQEDKEEFRCKIRKLESQAHEDKAEFKSKIEKLELLAQEDEAAIKKLELQIKPVGDAPKQSHFADLDIRLKTFEDWPPDSPVSPRALAEAGFYHDTGTESPSLASACDSCRCFFCGVRFAGWKLNDDPFVEHARPRLTCPFIKQCKGEAFIQAARKLAENGRQVTKWQVETAIREAEGKKKGQLITDVSFKRLVGLFY